MERSLSLSAKVPGRMNTRLIPLAAGLLLTAVACRAEAAYAPNLIVDGGFDTPPLSADASVQYTIGEKIGGPDKAHGPWTVVGSDTAGDIYALGPRYFFKNIWFKPQRGSTSLDLTGSHNRITGVRQTVTTVPDARYRLVFWVGNVTDPTNNLGVTSTVNVLLNGKALKQATNKHNAPHKQQWQRFSTDFIATGNAATLEFDNGDLGSDGQCGLDSVLLVQVRAAPRHR